MNDETTDADAEEQRRVGALVKQRRHDADLSRAKLAQMTGLSESTLKNLELGYHRPNHATLQALLAVPALKLQANDLFPATAADSPTEASSHVMNAYLAPGFDPIQTVFDLQKLLAGAGGVLEQSFLYLDTKSAQDWFALVNVPSYAASRDLRHLHTLAALVQKRVGTSALDVLGLGCGDGAKELRLVHLLQALPAPPSVRLFLLDISQPLLGHAFHKAVQVLPTSVFALQGDFHRLPFFETFLAQPAHSATRRLVCMFGGTFGNLPNEVQFLRNNFAVLKPGDLLLLHMGRVRAPRNQPRAVARLDSQLAGLPPDLAEKEHEWLTGPIERFSRRVGEPLPRLTVESRFDTSCCPVPESYAIEKAVVIHEDGKEPRRFVVNYVKRYEPVALGQTLSEEGWDTVQIWDDEVGDHLLCLFERR